MRVRNILVRSTNWVGDAVMSVPALQALREAHPDARIAVLARPWVADLYGREPFCDELIPYTAPKGWRGLREKWRAASDLRRRKFDCAILFQNAFEAAALVRAAGIRTRIGYARDARSLLLTHPIPVPRPGETPRHQRFYYLELLRRAGLIEGYREAAAIRLSVAHTGGAGSEHTIIGVSPGAAYGGAKRWLPERFAAAAVDVARERGASVAIFGSKDERSICETVRAGVAAAGIAARNYAGETTLGEFIQLASRCEVFLTNDSGAMHIASALGVPTIAIFGATDHIATGPTGTHARVLRHAVECSPCLLRECPIDHRCMKRVESREVAEAALNLIAIEKV